MAFSIQDIGKIDHLIGQWCLNRVPPHLKKEIDHDYEIDGQAVTLLEVRPLWQGQPGEITRRPFARFRYVKTTGLWQIYWMRQNGKWHAYDPDSASSLEEALDIMEADRYGCFFG